MAIVKDYYIGNTHVQILDDAYRDLTPEELHERQERIKRNIFAIVAKDEREKLERQIAQEEEAENDRSETHI